MKAKEKVQIDWDTVELVGILVPASTSSSRSAPAVLSEQPTRPSSVVKQILSGAAQKARTRGASHTHTQLRKLIPAGLEMLAYGWRLVAAAVESDRDVARAVELAALAIIETSQRVQRSCEVGAAPRVSCSPGENT